MFVLNILHAVIAIASLEYANATRQLSLWLYSPTASNETWAAWYADLVVHRVNITGVSPCSYLMDGQGNFTTQVWEVVVRL